jgi:uncharacterized protein YjbJ (UPF0337 family)
MDKEPISRAAKKVRVSITESLGKLTGDKATERKGTAQEKEAEAELPRPNQFHRSKKKSASQFDRIFDRWKRRID